MRCLALVLALLIPTVAAADRKADVAKVFDKLGPKTPGCSVGVMEKGKVVHAAGYGMANLELGVPNGPETVFDIGSTSKQITAFSVLTLAAEGKLALDDDVRKYLPELPAYPGGPVTLRQLLHHTSGVRDYTTLMALGGANFEEITGDKEALDILVRQKGLDFKPGTEWEYSNSGYFLLSLVVKKVAGKSLRAFADERIFQPLGMTRTHIHDNHREIVPGRAQGYSPGKTAGFEIEMSGFEQTGDGAVMSTVLDLLRWAAAFKSNKVGSAALFTQMQTPGKLSDGKAIDYAFGLFVREREGLREVGHGGAWAGYRAQLVRVPDRDLAVAVLCNVASSDPVTLAHRVVDVYLDRKPAVVKAPAPVTPAEKPTADELKRFAGVWRNPEDGDSFTLVVEDDHYITEANGMKFKVIALSKTRFTLPEVPRIIMDFEPSPLRLVITQGESKKQIYHPVAAGKPAAGPKLALYAGRFTSDELGTTYLLAEQGDKLLLTVPRSEPAPLVHVEGDTFTVPMYGVSLKFTKDRKSFTLDAGRVKGLTFRRL
jgi:CubicO group peptidase (beta-lactamase class C family)